LSRSSLTNREERKTNQKEKTMTAATRKLNIRRNFRRAKLDDLLSRAHTVFTNMGINVGVFATPPSQLTTLKQDSDNLATSNAAAKEGGPKEIAQREKDRLTLEHDLDLLGSYALKVANGDPAVLTSSGFIPLPPRIRSEPQPLPTPGAPEIEQGVTGQFNVSVSPIKGAHNYEVHFAPVVNGLPGTWTIATLAIARKPLTVTGLTPGTTYAFQVRAFGKAGWTDWSASATRMAI
jgi:Fibronectin type III domain